VLVRVINVRGKCLRNHPTGIAGVTSSMSVGFGPATYQVKK
jgi:hypothetical protein